MKKTIEIWKHSLPLAGHVEINMPIESDILSVQAQHNVLTMWTIGDSSKEKVTRRFEINMTGEPLENYIVRQYIGTVQFGNGNFVTHVFELPLAVKEGSGS